MTVMGKIVYFNYTKKGMILGVISEVEKSAYVYVYM